MQDCQSGIIHQLDTSFIRGLTGPARVEGIQKAKDGVQPDRTKQGPVYEIGEVIEIKGRFQITRIEPGHMRLKSLPRD